MFLVLTWNDADQRDWLVKIIEFHKFGATAENAAIYLQSSIQYWYIYAYENISSGDQL